MANKHLRRGSMPSFIRKYKFNSQWNTITHTERNTYKQRKHTLPQLTKPSAHEDVEQLEHLYVANGNENCNNHCVKQFGRFLFFFNRVKHILSAWLSSAPPRYFPKRMKTFVHTYTQKLYMNIYVGFIHNHQNMIQPKCPSTEDG